MESHNSIGNGKEVMKFKKNQDNFKDFKFEESNNGKNTQLLKVIN